MSDSEQIVRGVCKCGSLASGGAGEQVALAVPWNPVQQRAPPVQWNPVQQAAQPDRRGGILEDD